MKPFAVILAAFGLVGLVTATFGPGVWLAGFHGAYHSAILSRIVAGISGVCSLLLAWGIYRRSPAAWRFAFLALGLFWIHSVIYFSVKTAANYPRQSDLDSILFAIFLLLVSSPFVIYWAYRWYRQKQYFYGKKP